jgi:hypothetical protein
MSKLFSLDTVRATLAATPVHPAHPAATHAAVTPGQAAGVTVSLGLFLLIGGVIVKMTGRSSWLGGAIWFGAGAALAGGALASLDLTLGQAVMDAFNSVAANFTK